MTKQDRPIIANCIFGHKFVLNKNGEKAIWYYGKKKKALSTIFICPNHVIWFDLWSFLFHKLYGFWNWIDKTTKPNKKEKLK